MMKTLRCCSLVLLGWTVACGGPRADVVRAPSTRLGTDSTVYHGVRVDDPYRWLEGSDAEVKSWITAQNDLTDRVMAGFAEGPAIEARVSELATTSPDRSSPAIVGGTLFYLQETPPAPQPVLVAQPWPSGPPRTLVDVNGSGGSVAITGYWPSPTGRYVAYSTATGGSEVATIHVIDVASAKVLAEAIPYCGGGTSPAALAWDADERGFTFARFPVPETAGQLREFDVALFHHRLGTVDDSVPALGAGYSPIAEWRLLTSESARDAAALVFKGDGGFADGFLRAGATWRRAFTEDAGVTTATYANGRLLVVATRDAPKGRVLSVSPDGGTREVVPEGDWAIASLEPIAGGLLVVRVAGPRWRVDHYTTEGTLVRTLALPAEGIAIGNIASSSGSSEALVTYEGWTTPTTWVRYDGESGEVTQVFEVRPSADYSKVVVHGFDATSRDGTKIPVTVVALATTPQDGSAPAILTAYGGFRIPFTPRFIGARLAWLERGGVLAFANLRGGNDFGETWHQDGAKTKKQNVFDDFYAAAQALEAQRWTQPDRLGITGGSNGGLLMGAALVQHPEAYRAVVSFVGIYDMLRHELFPNGAYNVTEYGRTEDPAEFQALHAYSPLHHVQQGAQYPAILMETGLNDPRVAPWQSRKFTAALQAATGSANPVLLLTRSDAGHGIGAPFSQRVGNIAVMLTFFAHELAPEQSGRQVP
jgi:prolyl oligopeptidase